MVGFVSDASLDTPVAATLRGHYKCFLICVLVALSTFQYGFDTGVVNGLQATDGFLQIFGTKSASGALSIQTTFQQLIISLPQVGLVLASAMVGPFSAFFGRRAGFAVASVITITGITVQILVTVQWPVYVSRLLLGIGHGIYVNMTILYISEAAPAPLRGLMVAVFQPLVNFGSLLAAIISNALHNNPTKQSYQIQMSVLYVAPLLLGFAAPLLPESPRWLVVHRRDNDARKNLARLRPASSSEAQVDEELSMIKRAVNAEHEIASTVVWRDIWRSADLRRTLLSCACATFHAAAGELFISSYATFFFQIAGSGKPFANTIIIQSVSVGASLLALPLARRFNRRTLLLTGFALTTISMFSIAIIYTVAPDHSASGRALVALLCIFLGGYSATVGPLSWVTAGEMSSNRLRSYTFGVGMTVGFIFAWLETFTTPYFINTMNLNWGGKVAWIWGPSNLIAFIFVYFVLPETKGLQLEEVDELFYNRIPTRKFSDCMDTRRMQDSGTPSVQDVIEEKFVEVALVEEKN